MIMIGVRMIMIGEDRLDVDRVVAPAHREDVTEVIEIVVPLGVVTIRPLAMTIIGEAVVHGVRVQAEVVVNVTLLAIVIAVVRMIRMIETVAIVRKKSAIHFHAW